MKKYRSPEMHIEMIAPEETLLLSYSDEGDAVEFDLGQYLKGKSRSSSTALGFEDFE